MPNLFDPDQARDNGLEADLRGFHLGSTAPAEEKTGQYLTSPFLICPAFQLNARAKREAVGSKRRARGVAAFLEMLSVNRVERRPLAHIGEHNGAFEHIVKTKPVSGELLFHPFEYPARFRLYPAGNDSSPFLIHADITG